MTNQPTHSELFAAEAADTTCLSDKVKELAPGYDVIIVGSVDELLARKNTWALKHCDLPSLPTGTASGMPLGLLGRHHHPYYHYRDYPTAYVFPTVYSSDWATHCVTNEFKRYASPGPNDFVFFPPEGSTPMIGGMHLSMYCFVPAMILKEMWSTE